jgi:hypothetical protein
MSRGFVCALFGFAMTLFSWFAPWSWPAWPALTMMKLFPDFADYAFSVRGGILVLLIFINSAFWAAAGWVVWWAAQRLTARRRAPLEP